MVKKESIPKIIHYCWFGRQPKPKKVIKCIESWRKILPDYEIIEWNESNFNLEKNNYVQVAYESKKYAFVSDYVRLYALYHIGGIYLDTDVEVIKSFNPFLNEESFWGFEEKNYIATSTFGAKKGNLIIKEFLNKYEDESFCNHNPVTNVKMVTDLFIKYGLKMNGDGQKIKNLATIYSQEYFSPYDYINCHNKMTNNTYAIHYFYKSWLPFSQKIKQVLKKILVRLIGTHKMNELRSYKDILNKYLRRF